MHLQYTTYIKQDAIITFRWYLAGHDRNSQISPNCNYCILFDVCCVLTVHNILYRFDNKQRDGLSKKKVCSLLCCLVLDKHKGRTVLFCVDEKQSWWHCLISDFRHGANEICALLRTYTAQTGNSVSTFGDNPSVLGLIDPLRWD